MKPEQIRLKVALKLDRATATRRAVRHLRLKMSFAKIVDRDHFIEDITEPFHAATSNDAD
jgi:hypothetical protein